MASLWSHQCSSGCECWGHHRYLVRSHVFHSRMVYHQQPQHRCRNSISWDHHSQDFIENVLTISAMTAPSGTSLSANTVEWIVEDFSSGGLVPFANFGEVTFTNCIGVAAPSKFCFSFFGASFWHISTSGFNAYNYIYPNSTTAYAGDIVAIQSGATAYTPITSVSFPGNADQVIEVNYIGFD